MRGGPERVLVFVRHAEPIIDPGVPPVEWGLSAAGRAHAESLWPRVRAFSPVRAYTSPEPKARETARWLLERSGLRAVALPGLAEQDRTGVPFYDDEEDFRAAVRAVFRRADRAVLGPESGDDARDRFAAAVRAACREGEGNLLFITHGTVLSLFLGEALGRDPFALWEESGFGALAAITWPDPGLVEWRPAG